MDNERERPGAYAKRVVEDTQRYVQELIAEKDRLERNLAGSEDERGSLANERLRLKEELLAVREELERERREHGRLLRRLADIEGEGQTHAERYRHIEAENSNLANLYVASYRLHATIERDEVLEAIKEVVINLIGCEEFLVLESSKDGSELHLTVAVGLSTENWKVVPQIRGRIGQTMRRGDTFIRGSDPASDLPEEANLTACVPLKVGDDVIGVIALFRLLPQKVGKLNPLDRELFELLGNQAATALYLTTQCQAAIGGSLEVAVAP